MSDTGYSSDENILPSLTREQTSILLNAILDNATRDDDAEDDKDDEEDLEDEELDR